MKGLKIMIIIVVIIIAVLIGLLFYLSSNSIKEPNLAENAIGNNTTGNSQLNNYENNVTNSIDDSEEAPNQPLDTAEADPNVKAVTNITKFFTVSNCIQQYIDSITQKDSTAVYSLLDESYINTNHITKNNILSNTGNKAYEFTPLKMNILEGLNTEAYAVYGKVLEKQTSGLGEDIYFIVNLCTNNFAFSIYPLSNYTNINQINLKNDDKDIARNDYNFYSYYRITDEDLIRKYMSNFKINIAYNIDNSYNLIDSEYKSKKWNGLSDYKTYIENNMNTIRSSILKSYLITKDGDITYYDYIDNYGNHYVFKATAVMQYTVFLDEYTVLVGDNKKQYDEFDKYNKGKYNLSNFIKMVNTKSYKQIYDALDPTFKNNNFKTQENLKQFIESNMYATNSIEITEVDRDTYEYYVFNCKLTNEDNKSETKDMVIILNQEDGTNFTMSFSF